MSKKIWERCVSDILVYVLTTALDIRYSTDEEDPKKLGKDIYTLLDIYIDEFIEVYNKYIEKMLQCEFKNISFQQFGDNDCCNEDGEMIEDIFKNIMSIIHTMHFDHSCIIWNDIICPSIEKAWCYPLLEEYFDVNTLWIILNQL